MSHETADREGVTTAPVLLAPTPPPPPPPPRIPEEEVSMQHHPTPYVIHRLLATDCCADAASTLVIFSPVCGIPVDCSRFPKIFPLNMT